MTFVETAYIEADSLEDLKEKLPSETLDWSVDFEYDPTVEKIVAYDETGEDFETCLEFSRRYISKMIVEKTAPKQFHISFEYTKPLVLIRYDFRVEIRNKKAVIYRINEDGTEDFLDYS